MRYELVINDKKTGWANAKDELVASVEQAVLRAKELQQKSKRLEFALTISSDEGRYLSSLYFRNGTFVE